MEKQQNILVIEDERLIAMKLKADIECLGHHVTVVDNFENALSEITSPHTSYDQAFVDLELKGDKGGFHLLPHLKENNIRAIVLTSHASEHFIEKGYREGCDNYLSKPHTLQNIEDVLSKDLTNRVFDRFDKYLAEHFFTVNKSLLLSIERFKDGALNSQVPILLTGPTGTGKTTLAKAVHVAIHGNDRKFIETNCSTIKASFAESILFGHKKGSFSDAKENHAGLLEEANGGTLFLDEIATLPKTVQNKLLKALEERQFYPLGSSQPISSNFRIISATREDVFQLIANGEFRNDLFFRVSGVNLNIPGLSSRRDDIDHLITRFKETFGRAIVIKEDARKVLLDYCWPGNVRQLKTFFDLRKNMKKPIIDLENLPREIIRNEDSTKNGILTKEQIQYVKDHGLRQFLHEAKKAVVASYPKSATNRQIGNAIGWRHQGVGDIRKEMGGGFDV